MIKNRFEFIFRPAPQHTQAFGYGNTIVDPRRQMEARDFSLINDDYKALSNLPSKAKIVVVKGF